MCDIPTTTIKKVFNIIDDNASKIKNKTENKAEYYRKRYHLNPEKERERKRNEYNRKKELKRLQEEEINNKIIEDKKIMVMNYINNNFMELVNHLIKEEQLKYLVMS